MILGIGERFLSEIKSTSPNTLDREDALIGFVATPYYAERVLSFGTLLALDSFLHTLTILPLRALYQIWRKRWSADVIQVIIIGLSFRFIQGVNTSRVYHAIRGQGGITIFVLYSLMEVCDKFLCSVGHEISACLTSQRTYRSRRRTIIYSVVNLAYMIAHSFVLMWQLVTLNLAVNSYSNALLSFMLTNQFSEIKSAVFKRFDKHSLFQLTCADITQRFQFAALLLVIVLRNLLEHLTKSETSLLTLAAWSKILGPASLIMGTVIIVDWLKLAYIMNFNDLSLDTTFSDYLVMLKRDYAVNDSQRGHQSLVSKQAGLPVAALVIVCVRMFAKGGVIMSPFTPILFMILLLVKLELGNWLYKTTLPTKPTQETESETEVEKETEKSNVKEALESEQKSKSSL